MRKQAKKGGSQVPALFGAVEEALAEVPVPPLARQSGFERRKPRKLAPLALVQAACKLALQQSVSLRHWAILIGLAARTVLSKQDVKRRLGHGAVAFMVLVLQDLLGRLFRPSRPVEPAVLAPFGRVLLQDSTTARVHPKLARLFRGGRNQRGRQDGQLKIQAIYDLKCEQWVAFGLGDYRRNDQAASPDILPVVRAGDLVLRDLGYWLLGVLRQIQAKSAFFLSRWHYGVQVFWPDGRPVNLLRELRARGGCWDARVLVGAAERLPVRLVALPLSQEQAAARRRKARAEARRDGRSHPSRERLALLGWALFLTNVSESVWSARTVAKVYGLRWRVESVFKAWKSHFQFTHLPTAAPAQLQVLVYARLLLVCLFQLYFGLQEQYRWESQGPPRPAFSLLKLAGLVRDYAWWMFWLELSPEWAQLLYEQISYHCRYEPRKKRNNFYQNLWS